MLEAVRVSQLGGSILGRVSKFDAPNTNLLDTNPNPAPNANPMPYSNTFSILHSYSKTLPSTPDPREDPDFGIPSQFDNNVCTLVKCRK